MPVANLLERLFVEERRRLKIIPNAFGEKAVLKLMFGAMTRPAEGWRSIRITEFERRQMAALREELDQDYEAAVCLEHPPLKACCGHQNSQQLSGLPPAGSHPTVSSLVYLVKGLGVKDHLTIVADFWGRQNNQGNFDEHESG